MSLQSIEKFLITDDFDSIENPIHENVIRHFMNNHHDQYPFIGSLVTSLGNEAKNELNHKGQLIFLEGGIGAGKTTLGKIVSAMACKSGKKCIFMSEPMDLDELEIYISDPKTHALSFQLSMLTHRVNVLNLAKSLIDIGHSVILDRSIYGDRVFEHVNWSRGNIGDEEHITYLKKFMNFKKIYHQLCSDAQIWFVPQDLNGSIENIKKRSRRNELNGYSLDYLEEVIKVYEKYSLMYLFH